MSALGHKQTCAPQKAMSALPPKADMFSVEIEVCFVPRADMPSVAYAVPESAMARSRARRPRAL